MPESQSTSSTGGASTPAGFGSGRGIRFQIKTGGKSWACTLQDRSSYERMKATRTSSTDSVGSNSSSASSQRSL
ncbi:hypothetical protein ACRE_051890 [Hapsidospora chrysogenum ATCC 11550]|uniref:Uncharacterized protein n=1 Tax=Hapsidospora chrysogenum (strain ATCC 11550 / CBS 779.69 / DSM 880 / IAM 14645 / JCM 23072 / IMI 49137) TaxID=857340 RepID=A0A086T3V3_HAPC1|nr:hypothetical protein ACRE_051890 [Hapsidospora chrysogenum ATCC 11550]